MPEGDLRAEFDKRVSAWSDATGGQSSPWRIFGDETFHRLMALGSGIVPLILEDMRDGSGDGLYPALRAFTGASPIAEEEQGDVLLMDAAWVRWGRENGYLDA